MKYMVVECHFGYAVVLDEQGRFCKVANRRYEVGQTVTDVIEMHAGPEAAPQKRNKKWLYSLAALAACFILVVTSALYFNQRTYASVYMTINPQVRIDVNRNDAVVGLEGVNADGKELIEGYCFQKKALDLVCDELIDRAIDLGYLHEGGRISLRLDAKDSQWVVRRGDTLSAHLDDYLSEKLSVSIEVKEKTPSGGSVTIPVKPGQSEYGESDYGEGPSGQTSASDRDEGSRADEDDDYSDDGNTDYHSDEDDGVGGEIEDDDDWKDDEQPDDDDQEDDEQPDDDQSDESQQNDLSDEQDGSDYKPDSESE